MTAYPPVWTLFLWKYSPLADWSDPFDEQDPETRENVERFEQTLSSSFSWFFDSEELEQIFDYYLERGHMDKAEQVLTKGLEQSPNHAGFMLRKAQMMMGSGEIRQAEELLDKALRINPTLVELHLTRSSLYDYRNQTNRALLHLRKAEQLADAEQMPSVHLAFGMVFMNAGRWRSALDHFLLCVQKEQVDQEHLLYDLGYCYHQLDLMDDGIAFFEEQINQNPFSDAAWYNQGILYNQAGLFEKALDAFEYALLIRPDLSMAHFNRANTFINLEKYPEALEQMQEAIHCEPDYPLFVNGLGVCYEKLNRIDEALARYEAAAVLDPLLADAWFGQAACKAQSESWSAALVLINRALELAADHEEYWYEKGRILMALARYDEAEQVLAEALRLDEGFWEARILLVSLFLAVDRYEDALRCIQDGQEPHKDDAAYFFELAGLIFAFEIKELLDLAHTCLQWALSVDPSESHHLLTFWPDAHNNKEIVALLREYKALD